ncbi:hypothetical protein CPC16_004217 [Podila verticillata]|nr:hypothetical protein CPC16_004217 [Podila verticillata]
MRKVLSLFSLVLFVVTAAPTYMPAHQQVFAPLNAHHCAHPHGLQNGHHRFPYPDKHGGLIYLPPSKTRRGIDLDAEMLELIKTEMAIAYNATSYVASFKATICRTKDYEIEDCEVEVLSTPQIQLIPTNQISKDIICTTPTCMIGLEESVTVSTTHSAEVGLSIGTGAIPFGVGVSFTGSTQYGFSSTTATSTSLVYHFDLVQGDRGFVGMVNAQISAQVRIAGCKCPRRPSCVANLCRTRCAIHGPAVVEVGHHEAVVMKNEKPRGGIYQKNQRK